MRQPKLLNCNTKRLREHLQDGGVPFITPGDLYHSPLKMNSIVYTVCLQVLTVRVR